MIVGGSLKLRYKKDRKFIQTKKIICKSPK
jgi:hypothetical protein